MLRDVKMSSASSPVLYTSVFVTWSASDLIDSPDACLNRSNRRIHFYHSSGFEKSIGDGGAIWYDGVAGVAIIPLLRHHLLLPYSYYTMANFDWAVTRSSSLHFIISLPRVSPSFGIASHHINRFMPQR